MYNNSVIPLIFFLLSFFLLDVFFGQALASAEA